MADGAAEWHLPKWVSRLLDSKWILRLLLLVGWLAAAVAGKVDAPWLLLTFLAVGGGGLWLQDYLQTSQRKREQLQLDAAHSKTEARLAESHARSVLLHEQYADLLSSSVSPIVNQLMMMALTPDQTERRAMVSGLRENVVEAASRLFGLSDPSGTRSVYYELQGSQLRRVSQHGRPGNDARPFLPGRALVAARTGKPQLYPDVRKHPQFGSLFGEETKYKTFMSCPVMAGDELRGVLTVDAMKVGTLGGEDLRTVMVLARLLGLILTLASRTQIAGSDTCEAYPGGGSFDSSGPAAEQGVV